MALRLTQRQYEDLMRKPKRARPPKRELPPDGVMLEPGYLLLVLPIPPSRNAEPKHWAARQDMKCFWSVSAYDAWLAARMPRMKQVQICPVYFHRGGRGRDHDNYVNLATKGVLDGLKGHLVTDDNSELVTLQAAEFLVDKGAPRLELHVMEVRD